MTIKWWEYSDTNRCIVTQKVSSGHKRCIVTIKGLEYSDTNRCIVTQKGVTWPEKVYCDNKRVRV